MDKHIEPDAVEKKVCYPIYKSVFVNSTTEQLDGLQKILFGGASDAEEQLKTIMDRSDLLGREMKIFYKRVQTFPIKFDFKLILWIPTHFGGNLGLPGCLVMAYYLEWFAFKMNVKKLGLKRTIEKCFPAAVPSEETIIDIINAQRLEDGTNLIDLPEAVQSFMKDYEIDWNKEQ